MVKLKVIEGYENVRKMCRRILQEKSLFEDIECGDREQFELVADGELKLSEIGIASENGKIVGFVAEWPILQTYNPNVRFSKIILPKYRKQGIYHKLREMLSGQPTLERSPIFYKLFMGSCKNLLHKADIQILPNIEKMLNIHSKYKLGIAFVNENPVGVFFHEYRKKWWNLQYVEENQIAFVLPKYRRMGIFHHLCKVVRYGNDIPCGVFDSDLNQNTLKILRILYRKYASRAKSISYGRNRVVFELENNVVKIPRNVDGINDNDWEGSISNGENMGEDDIVYARTRLAYIQTVPIVFMEKVDTDIWDGKDYGDFPDWVGCVDCGQVGINRHGKLVAYDYGRS